MRITRLETLQADAGWRNFSFLKLSTDEGLVGWAEYNEGYGAGGVSEIVHRFAPLVTGMDPREVGKIGAMLRASTRMAAGGLNHQAIAADRERLPRRQGEGARRAGLCAVRRTVPPAARALLVALRELSRLAARCVRDSSSAWRRSARSTTSSSTPGTRVARGFKALKTNHMPLWPGSRQFNPGFRMMPDMLDRRADNRFIGEITEILAAFRDGIGPDIGLLFDLNFNQRTDGFMRIAKAVEPYRPDVARSRHPRSRRRSRSSAARPRRRSGRSRRSTACATIGLISKTVRSMSPSSTCTGMGVGEGVRIATLADAYEVDVAPHNYTGHLATLISAHFCAAIPNFRIMEIEIDDVPWKDEFVTVPPVIENGELIVPSTPGWGTEVNEEAIRAHPPKARH